MNEWKRSFISLLLLLTIVINPIIILPLNIHAATTNQNNIVGWANYYYNITWTAKSNVDGWRNRYTFYQGQTYHIPYAQPISAGAYIGDTSMGYGVSVEDFLSSANNADSLFYTNRSSNGSASSVYYGMDCSSFVSSCWGITRHTTHNASYGLPNVSNYIAPATTANFNQLQLGDALDNYPDHVMLVTGLQYDSYGNVSQIQITEQTPPEITQDWYTPASLVSHFYGRDYYIYRYDGDVPAPPSDIPIGSQTISDGEYHIVSMLDDSKGINVYGAFLDNGANIDLYSNLNDPNQVFDITYLGDGNYKIINQHSGKSLDCAEAGITAGTNLQQWDYSGDAQQQWIIQETGDGESFYIISKKSGLCIDVDGASTNNGTNIHLFTPNQSNAQKWKFITWGGNTERTVSDGEYHIASRLNSSMCLDVYAAAKNNSANIDLYTNLTVPEQVFIVSYLGNGYYKIINKNSEKSLDLQEAKCTNGTNLQQYDYSDAPQKQWIIKPTSDGKAFNIISKKGGLYIDVQSGEAKNLQNVQGYIANGSAAQQWRFIPWFDNNQKTIPNGEYRIITGADESKALDIYGAQMDNMTNVQIYSNLNDKNQTFDIEYNDDGAYSIVSHYSKKTIDVYGNQCVKGTNVVIYDNNGGNNQKWRISPDDNGYYSIVSCSCGLALDLNGGKSADQTNVQVWTKNDTIAQKWKLRRVINEDMITVKDVTVNSATDTINPEITVIVDDEVITQDGNYQVDITTDFAAEKGTITITGINNYCDSVTKEFKIDMSDILGDVDGNGDVDNLDAAKLLKHISGTETLNSDVLKRADMDYNGEVDMRDVILILKKA